MTDQKDETILALQEMVSELTSKLINLRIASGIKIKELNIEIAALKEPDKVKKIGERN